MRKLTTPIVLTGVLVSLPALAQDLTDDPAPEPSPSVEVDAADADGDASEEAEAEQPAAATTSSASGSVSVGGTSASGASTAAVGGPAIVQMGDVKASGSPGGPGGPPATSSAGGNYGGPRTSAEDEWKFGFHGYFRAPMRIGIGSRIDPKQDQKKTTLSTPQIPSDQYLDWQYTRAVQRSWAEAFFSYGNSFARGVFALQAFRFSDAAWPDPEAQFGISQGWVELTPDMSSINDALSLTAKFGNFWGRYGGAGQYDAGAYDTFISGRTHTMGENVHLQYEWGDWIFWVEQGFGVKQPNPSPFHNTKFTLLAHGHLGFNWDQFITLNLHVLHAWTQEPDHACISREEEVAQLSQTGLPQERTYEFTEGPVGACKHETIDVQTADGLSRRADSPDGSLNLLGADVVFDTSTFGRFFLGYSHITAKHAVTVAPAFEAVHANGGGFFKSGFTHQYFNERTSWEDPVVLSEGGNGTLDTFAFQWDFSLASLLGLTHELDLQLFGMLNLVRSDDDPQLANISKLKYGGDVVYSPLPWLGAGFRMDRVQPRSDIPEQSFTSFSPRLILRSDFATHEEIWIGYTYFAYAQRECASFAADPLVCTQVPGATVAPDGFGNLPGVNASKQFRGAPLDIQSERGPFPDQGWDPPHEHVINITASIWW